MSDLYLDPKYAHLPLQTQRMRGWSATIARLRCAS